VKCSLLTLSTFIDGELPDERRSEVDAHLVGCPRCTAGAASLREEKARVAQLARVHVDPESAQSMLEQVGIAIDSAAPLAPSYASPAPPQPSVAADQLPWQSGLKSPALPWTPRRPDARPAAAAEPALSSIAPDVQPDLPLDVVTAEPAVWQPAAAEVVPAFLEADPAGAPSEVAAGPPGDVPDEADDGAWSVSPSPAESWEAALPPPVDTSPAHDQPWDVPAAIEPSQAAFLAPLEMSQPPLSPPLPPAIPLATAAPTRLAAASGPGALWARVRDAVAVRMALSRNMEPAEQSLQIVSGAPSRPANKLTPPLVAAAPEAAAQVAEAPPEPIPAPAADVEVELNGFARPFEAPAPARVAASVDRQAALAGSDPSRLQGGVEGDGERSARGGATAWNAFAASSYPLENDVPDQPPVVPPRPLGRHSRAVAREHPPVGARMGRALAGMVAALRAQTSAARASAGRGLSGVARSGPNSRLLAGVAGLGLIFVGALLIGHATAKPAPAAASRSAATAVTPPRHSAPAPTSAAARPSAVPSSVPSATAAQTFGSGAGGFQVIRLRYGAQATYMRVVFDLAAVTGQATGSPKVAVSFTGPTTMLVTFTGAPSAGSWRAPPAGNVISAVTLVSSGSQKTVYRFDLTHAVTTTGFYLAAPTRFVLDLH
jgi:hypothetical protein